MKNEQFLVLLQQAFAESSVINSVESARNALLGPNCERLRFVAWNIILGILTEDSERWSYDALMHYNWYWNIVESHFKDCPEWLDISDRDFPSVDNLPLEQGSLMMEIHTDVIRTCATLVHGFSPGINQTDPVHRRIERILYSIALFSPEMGYAQGFDRFAFILYVFSLDFFTRHNLSIDFAEAFAYTMTMRFLYLIRFHKFITSEEVLLEWISGYQQLLERFHPEAAIYLSEIGVAPVQYAFKWFALLFAGSHKAEDVFRIWDQCLLHANDIHKYLFSLAVAHVSQIFNKTQKSAIQPDTLNQFNDWEMDSLIKDADTIYDGSKRPPSRSRCCSLFS